MKELKNLLQVKKIIAILLALVFCILAFKGVISSEQFMTVFTVVVSFYFAQSTVRDSLKDKKDKEIE